MPGYEHSGQRVLIIELKYAVLDSELLTVDLFVLNFLNIYSAV